MFNWKKDKISAKLTDTFIGEGTIVEGTIRSEGGVRLEGQLRGDLSCKGDVVIGESGFAVSNMTANNVILAGQVTGNVHIAGKMTITATGKLYGDLTAATLTIEDGGVFQGKSTMDQDEPIAHPLDRRTGVDRRSGIDTGYTGLERRSGIDRRTGIGLVDSEVAAVPKKISFRAPAAVETDEAESLADVDPIKERGRAFLSSMSENGGGVRVGGDEIELVGEIKEEQLQQAQARSNEGLNVDERAALSSVVLTEAVAAAVVLGENEVAAGVEGDALVAEGDALGADVAVEPVALGADEQVTLDAGESVALGAGEPVALGADVAVEPVALGADVAAEPVALGADEQVAVEPAALGAGEAPAESIGNGVIEAGEYVALEPLEVDASELVTPDVPATIGSEAARFGASDDDDNSFINAIDFATTKSVSSGDENPAATGNIYGYGFEERANGSTAAADSERDAHSKPSNGRSAAEAAALLKNW
ncbi:bactofilin family protein [Paenibacillus silvisoli]|uniref:bactofilin family protein n=1 Tax=Paenibacillus silvisoli TaxID=3110539 RepID=UPI002804686C|nr:polymer-forming cytoskeletal protein [Paenibacillus silvisoli]